MSANRDQLVSALVAAEFMVTAQQGDKTRLTGNVQPLSPSSDLRAKPGKKL